MRPVAELEAEFYASCIVPGAGYYDRRAGHTSNPHDPAAGQQGGMVTTDAVAASILEQMHKGILTPRQRKAVVSTRSLGGTPRGRVDILMVHP
jgi:hypothetical protein